MGEIMKKQMILTYKNNDSMTIQNIPSNTLSTENFEEELIQQVKKYIPTNWEGTCYAVEGWVVKRKDT